MDAMKFRIRLDVRFEQLDDNGQVMNYSNSGTSMSQNVTVDVPDFMGVCGVLAEFDKLMKELNNR